MTSTTIKPLTPLMAKAINTIIASGGKYTAHGALRITFRSLESRGLVEAASEGEGRAQKFVATDAVLEVAVQLEEQGNTQGLHENI